MDWSALMAIVIQLAIFSMFVTSVIEVVKGISAVGVKGLIRGVWDTLVHNKQVDPNAFPVLNFAVAMLCCWAFNVTIMSYIFHNLLVVQQTGATPTQDLFARWIDYFGTASIIYLGSDQLFKRFLAVEQQAKEAMKQVKTDESSSSTKTVTTQETTVK